MAIFAITAIAAEAAVPKTKPVVAAEEFAKLFFDRQFDKAAARFDAAMSAGVPAEKLPGLLTKLEGELGPFRERGALRVERVKSYQVVFILCRFEKGTLDMKVAIDGKLRVSGLFFVPPAAAHRNKASQQKKQPEPISWWTVLGFVLIGFIAVVTGVPLILERVPPNPWYGFRVQATLENQAVWYPANRYLGKCSLVFGLFMIVTSVGLSLVPGINPLVYTLSCVGALVVGANVMLILSVLFLQSLSPPHVIHRDISAE